MCGIACIIHRDSTRAREAADQAVRDLLHRGPDDHGVEMREVPAGALALAQTRLSIRDLSPAGHQPMINPLTKDVLIYNGEIYNNEELRDDPALSGIHWRGSSDTETILWSYAVWGADCFRRMRGMYAAIIYDARQQRLIIARDHIGIKPLYYAHFPDGYVFASEIQAISRSGFLPGRVDRRAIAGFLAYGTIPEPLTMVEGIHAFPPGHVCDLPLRQDALSNSRLRCDRFWSAPAPRAMQHLEAVDLISGRLKHAVSSHLISDVPLGIFLSGGIDSTIIATLAAQYRDRDVDALTISLVVDPSLDEGGIAARTAQRLGIRHHLIGVPEQDVLGSFDNWLAACDQPSIDGFNTFLVSGAARKRGFTVALSGLGGDELFAGYPSFRQLPHALRLLQKFRHVPVWMRRGAARVRGFRSLPSQREKLLDLSSAPPDLSALYLLRRRQFGNRELARLGVERSVLALDDHWLAVEAARDLPDDPIAAISMLESDFYMRNMLLHDSDVFTMRHGLELRVPFLDQSLLEAAFSVPGPLRTQGWDMVNKPLLVQALGQALPAEVTNPAKRCFALPYARWIQGPLRDRFESLVATVADAGVLEPDGVRATWKDFLEDSTGSLWARAWMLGVLGSWLERSSAHSSLRQPFLSVS